MQGTNKKNIRTEKKYLIDSKQALQIEEKLKKFCTPDTHCRNNNCYSVRSLYFDDIYNSCFYDSREGLPHREKFRLRIYNLTTENIFLEWKRKEFAISEKNRFIISKINADKLITGNYSFNDIKNEKELLYAIYAKFRNNIFSPKVIVDYERKAYNLPSYNIRITIDSNIKASANTNLFYNNQCPTKPVLNNGKSILEIKYSQIIPDYLCEIINMYDLKRINYSKYYNCRKAMI